MNTAFLYFIILCSILIILMLLIRNKKLKIKIEEEKKKNYDITMEKNREKSINKQEYEENRKKEALNMYEANINSTRDMISNISHQWRQPLNTLMLMLANMEDAYRYDELDDEYFYGLISRSKKLINNMSSTIDDFRYLFNPVGKKEIFSPFEVVKSLMFMNEEDLIENDINIMLSEDEKDIEAYGDKGQYSQAIMNIINNSIDAHKMNDEIVDKRIEVKFYYSDKQTICEIQDNAGGISEEITDKIFDMYVTTKDSKSGTGIGLYIAKNIIENTLNGTIRCYNQQSGLVTVIGVPRSKEGELIGQVI